MTRKGIVATPSRTSTQKRTDRRHFPTTLPMQAERIDKNFLGAKHQGHQLGPPKLHKVEAPEIVSADVTEVDHNVCYDKPTVEAN